MKTEYFKPIFLRLPPEKRQKIIDAAVEEFSRNGFDSANVNNIASKSGISVGSIYKYFDSKEHLYLSIVNHAVETLSNVLYDIIKGEEDLETRIRKIIRSIQTYTRKYVGLTKLYNEMATENHSGLTWKLVSDMENVTAGLYASMIKDAQGAGIVREDIDPKHFAFFMDNLFIMLQFSYACEYYKERMKLYVGEDVFDNDEMVEEQLMKFIKGLSS